MKMTVVWATLALLVAVLTLWVPPCMMAAPEVHPAPWQEPCKEFHYHDHGTEHCEHCRDLCDAASAKGTMAQCWRLCQSYALVLWPPHLTPTPATGTPKPDAVRNDDKSSDDPQLALKIAIPLLAVVLIVGAALGLVIIRCRTNAQKRQQQRPPPDQMVAILNQTATVEIPDDVRENGSVMEESVGATHGTEASCSIAGIQEEGESGGSTVAHITQSHLNSTLEPRRPVPVSPEGDGATFAMALPQSSVRSGDLPTNAGQIPPSTSVYEPAVDLDSTELKSLLPSMSEDSNLC